MLSQRLLAAGRPAARQLRPAQLLLRRPLSITPIRRAEQEVDNDPGMNGGYINPIPEKRSLRDPYGDWWDKQERRNFAEPIHEDHDILGVFSLEEYRHMTPGKAAFLCSFFVAGILAVYGLVRLNYKEKPSALRTFEGGLEAELGGPKALRALKEGDSIDADSRL